MKYQQYMNASKKKSMIIRCNLIKIDWCDLIKIKLIFCDPSWMLQISEFEALLYAGSIRAWSNQGSVMCLLSILNQYK